MSPSLLNLILPRETVENTVRGVRSNIASIDPCKDVLVYLVFKAALFSLISCSRPDLHNINTAPDTMECHTSQKTQTLHSDHQEEISPGLKKIKILVRKNGLIVYLSHVPLQCKNSGLDICYNCLIVPCKCGRGKMIKHFFLRGPWSKLFLVMLNLELVASYSIACFVNHFGPIFQALDQLQPSISLYEQVDC